MKEQSVSSMIGFAVLRFLLSVLAVVVGVWIVMSIRDRPEPEPAGVIVQSDGHPSLKEVLRASEMFFRPIWEHGLRVVVTSHPDQDIHTVGVTKGAIFMRHRVEIPTMHGGEYLVYNGPDGLDTITNLNQIVTDGNGSRLEERQEFCVDVGIYPMAMRGELIRNTIVLFLPNGQDRDQFCYIPGPEKPQLLCLPLGRIVARREFGKLVVLRVDDRRGMNFQNSAAAVQ